MRPIRPRLIAAFVPMILLLALADPPTIAAEIKTVENWQADWKIQIPGGAYASREGATIRIGNAYLERIYRIVHESCVTAQLVNKVSQRNPGVQTSNEFALKLGGSMSGEFTAADFKLTDIASSDDDKGALRIIFSYRHRTNEDLLAKVTIETYPDRRYQHKWVTVDYTGHGDVTVEQIDVERTGGLGWWYIDNPSHFGPGQPLFVADLFMALESPAGETDANVIRHFPGRSAKGGLLSKPAVWGVARDHDALRQAFFDDYFYTLPGVKRAQPFVIWNLIGVGLPEEKLYTKAVDGIAASAKAAGIKIDCYAMDDPWADMSSIWQPDPARFPNGLDAFATKLQSMDSRLGLWLCLMGSGLDTHWGAPMGLETTTVADRTVPGRYCMAGPKYKAKIIQVLTDYVRNQKVNYFKLDYNTFTCDVPTHGHPVGQAGREAQIDAYCEILDAVKAVNPDCKVAITTGAWLSPWWIPHADYVWLGGNDVESAKLRNLTPQDSNTSGRDVMMYDDFVRNHFVFPNVNLMMHGFWENSGASFAKWQDDVMMTLGRGIAKWEILNSPASMDEKRWAFLSRAMKWARTNWDLLSNTQMILGDPGKGEVYGYAHTGKDAAIIVLRNPDIESKEIALSWSDMRIRPGSGWSQAREIYPAERELDWGMPLRVQVLGSETKVLVIYREGRQVEGLKF